MNEALKPEPCPFVTEADLKAIEEKVYEFDYLLADIISVTKYVSRAIGSCETRVEDQYALGQVLEMLAKRVETEERELFIGGALQAPFEILRKTGLVTDGE